MTLWSSEQAARATGGRSTRPWCASGISIDSRTLVAGDLFVALKDARDGHEFVAAAFAKGAAASMVSRTPIRARPDWPLIIVPDVLEGLNDLASWRRSECAARVVAVTGSVGKTTTKEMLKLVLGRQGRTHASAHSYNNHWGVPLSLARMPIDSQFAILEIGMSGSGEIEPLSKLARPHVALVTTIAKAHLAAFASVEDIAREKAAIFSGLVGGGCGIVNGDTDGVDLLENGARQVAARTMRFGRTDGCEFRLGEVRSGPTGTAFEYFLDGDRRMVRLSTPGAHFSQNALATLAAVQCCGGDPALAALDLARWQPLPGRGLCQRIVLDAGDENGAFVLIDDAYNANPTSMAASLKTLTGFGSLPNRVAFLGDMLELGHAGPELHRQLAESPSAEMIGCFHCIGPMMRGFHEALPPNSRGLWFEAAEDMAAQAGRLVSPGDFVLVKGSNGSRAWLVADTLKGLNRSQSLAQQE